MTDLDTRDGDITAYIAGDVVHDDEPLDLHDPDHADRLLAVLARLDHEQDRDAKLAAHRKQQIQDWLDEQNTTRAATRERLEPRLEAWARAHLEGSKVRTVKLPCGSVSLRKPTPRLVVTGEPPEDAPAEWVRVTRAWDKPALKQATAIGPAIEASEQGDDTFWAVDSNGEVINGVVYEVDTEDSCTIKPGAGK